MARDGEQQSATHSVSEPPEPGIDLEGVVVVPPSESSRLNDELTAALDHESDRSNAPGAASASAPSSSVAKALGRSALARVIGLPITAAATFVTLYFVVRYAGASGYGFVALVGALFQLIPFSDLGLGAPVTNAVSTFDESPEAHRRALATVGRSFRILATLSSALILAVWTLAAMGAWSPLLGLPPSLQHRESAVALALTIFFCSVPLGLGQRILIGSRRNHQAQLIAIAGPVVTTVVSIILIALKVPPLFLAVAAPTGVLAVSTMSFLSSQRIVGSLLRAIRDRGAATWSAPLLASGGAYLVVSIGVPLGMQSDRIVLSHFNSAGLSPHAVGLQFYAPVFSVVSAAATSLWPMFRRSDAQLGAVWRTAFKYLTPVGLFGAAGLLAFSGFASTLIGGGKVHVNLLLAASFALLVLVMTLHQPSATLLTDESDLRFQAWCVTAMAVSNIALSIPLALWLGAPGPVFASVIAVAACQLIPGVLRARRKIAAQHAS